MFPVPPLTITSSLLKLKIACPDPSSQTFNVVDTTTGKGSTIKTIEAVSEQPVIVSITCA